MSTLSDRQASIDKLFDDFIANSSEDESLDEMIEALDEVIYKALLEKLGFSDSNDEQKRLIRQKMSEYMISMEFNNPSLVHAEKMIRSIGASNFEEAAQYLEKLYLYRSREFSKSQVAAAKSPRKKDPFEKLLAKLVAKQPDISSEEVINLLESDTYSDVITEFDEDQFYYELPNGLEKSVKKINIPARLSRLRKKP